EGKAVKIGHGPATVNGRRASDGASGCESGNLPGLVEAGTLREKECGDGPRYSREAFLLGAQDICFWFDWRSECELRRWMIRNRRSAGPSVLRVNKSACATCREDFCFGGVEFCGGGLGREWR